MNELTIEHCLEKAREEYEKVKKEENEDFNSEFGVELYAITKDEKYFESAKEKYEAEKRKAFPPEDFTTCFLHLPWPKAKSSESFEQRKENLEKQKILLQQKEEEALTPRHVWCDLLGEDYISALAQLFLDSGDEELGKELEKLVDKLNNAPDFLRQGRVYFQNKFVNVRDDFDHWAEGNSRFIISKAFAYHSWIEQARKTFSLITEQDAIITDNIGIFHKYFERAKAYGIIAAKTGFEEDLQKTNPIYLCFGYIELGEIDKAIKNEKKADEYIQSLKDNKTFIDRMKIKLIDLKIKLYEETEKKEYLNQTKNLLQDDSIEDFAITVRPGNLFCACIKNKEYQEAYRLLHNKKICDKTKYKSGLTSFYFDLAFALSEN